MNYKFFIEELRKITPSIEDYLALGLNDKDAIRNVDAFSILPKKRKSLGTNNLFESQLLELIDDLDCSHLKIGLISFFHEYLETDTHFLIGNVELDLLAINKTLFEIEVLDHDQPDYIIWQCASNSESFLDALLNLAKYIYYKVKNALYFDPDGERECIKECISKAGGEKYSAFYEMLIQS